LLENSKTKMYIFKKQKYTICCRCWYVCGQKARRCL